MGTWAANKYVQLRTWHRNHRNIWALRDSHRHRWRESEGMLGRRSPGRGAEVGQTRARGRPWVPGRSVRLRIRHSLGALRLLCCSMVVKP